MAGNSDFVGESSARFGPVVSIVVVPYSHNMSKDVINWCRKILQINHSISEVVNAQQLFVSTVNKPMVPPQLRVYKEPCQGRVRLHLFGCCC